MIKLRSLSSSIYQILWIITLINNIVYPFNNDILNRITGYLGIMIPLVLIVICIFNRVRVHILDLICLCCIISIIIISYLGSSMQYIDNTFLLGVSGFLTTALLIMMQKAIGNAETNYRFIVKINSIFSLVYIFFSFFSFAYNYNGVKSSSLTLGYANPNATAILLMFNLFILIIKLKDNKLRGKFDLLYIIYIVFLIFLTKSRTCLIIALLSLTFIIKRNTKPIKKLIILICASFPVIYIFILISIQKIQKFKNIEILGKSIFTGREILFVDKFETLKEPIHFYFGNIGLNKFENAHNGPLSLIISIGLLGFLVYYTFILTNIMRCNKNMKNITNKLSVIFILIIFIYSSTEAAMITGGAPFSLMYSTLYYLARIEYK